MARLLAVVLLLAGSGLGQTTELASVDSLGNQGHSDSMISSIAGDGRCVAFWSFAINLVPGDSNGASDVFVHDRQTGTTQRVSVSSSGTQANYNSMHSSLSADGRYVAFGSEASNLVPGDTNGWDDVFVHDRQTGATELVSVSSSGNQGNFYSSYPAISRDGRYVAFMSGADNLVPGDTSGWEDIFVHDRQTGATQRASVDSSGIQADYSSSSPSISWDGRYVAFDSWATNLVPGDTNLWCDVFVHDRQTGATKRVSIDSYGGQGDGDSERPSIAGDARFVAFDSWASNLVPGDTNGIQDVFVHDRQTGGLERVSVGSSGNQGNDYSMYPSISADGRCVAFGSEASNLVPGDTNGWGDVFVHDRGIGYPTSPGVYCTAGTSASDCKALLSASGTPSATAASGFTLSAATVEGQKDGLFFFGSNGRQANSWGNGTSFQCVVPPVHRAGIIAGSGTNGACNGTFSQDLNARWCPTCPKPNHNPGIGAVVQVQLWYRDPANTSNQTTSLSDAIEFVLGP